MRVILSALEIFSLLPLIDPPWFSSTTSPPLGVQLKEFPPNRGLELFPLAMIDFPLSDELFP